MYALVAELVTNQTSACMSLVPLKTYHPVKIELDELNESVSPLDQLSTYTETAES